MNVQPTKLWNRNFTLYWSGILQAQLGSAISGVAFSYLVLELTNSVGSSALTLALTMLPGLLAPFAATWVDRLPLKLPLALGDALRGVLSLLVWYWAVQGELTPILLYVTSFINGLIGIFYSPAAQSALPGLVPAKDLIRANGLMGIANQSASIMGLIGGGFLVGQFGVKNTLLFDAVTFLVMAFLMLLIQFPARERVEEPNTYWQDLKAGFQVFAVNPLLRAIPVLGFMVMAAFAPLNTALPKHLKSLDVGPEGYGVLMGLLTGGMLLGNVLVSVLGEKFNATRMMLLAYLFNGVFFLLFAVAHNIFLISVLMVLIGMGTGLIMVSNSIILQTHTPRHMLGRAFGVLGATSQLGMPLTLLILPTFVDRIPLGWLFMGTGVVLLVLSVLWLQVIRRQNSQLKVQGVQA